LVKRNFDILSRFVYVVGLNVNLLRVQVLCWKN